MRATWGLSLLLLGCGHNPSPTHIDKVVVTDSAGADGGAGVARGGNDVAPTAGTKDDVLGRVFELGSEPSIPKSFAGLRPGMSRKDAAKQRPKSWGDAWSGGLDGEPGVVLSAGLDDGSDDPLQRLTVELEQRDAVARLSAAWGAPALISFSKSTVCWLASDTKLKTCHTQDLGHDLVQLVTYVPLMDALAESKQHTPASAYARLGKSKADILRAYPQAAEFNDPDDPTQHRLEVLFPTNEYTADVAPDRSVYYLDKSDKVIAIHVWYGANDPAVRASVKDALDAAVKKIDASDDTLVAVRDQDQGAVVVVLDRTPCLK